MSEAAYPGAGTGPRSVVTETHPAGSSPVPVTVIEAGGGSLGSAIRELFRSRDLLYFLAWRDVTVRYKQTALGVAWVVLQPLLTVLIFSVVFGRLAKMPSDGIPYPLFALAGLVPWTFFSAALTQAANSLLNSSGLITKIYFPRMAVPLGTILAVGVDFAVSLPLLFVALAVFRVPPTPRLLALPLFILITIAAAFGLGLWLSALNVRFRDIRHLLPFFMQIWLFATPVAYPSSLFPAAWRWAYALNPMVGTVEGFRWCLFNQGQPFPADAWTSAAVAVVLLVSGAHYFRRSERGFADAI